MEFPSTTGRSAEANGRLAEVLTDIGRRLLALSLLIDFADQPYDGDLEIADHVTRIADRFEAFIAARPLLADYCRHVERDWPEGDPAPPLMKTARRIQLYCDSMLTRTGASAVVTHSSPRELSVVSTCLATVLDIWELACATGLDEAWATELYELTRACWAIDLVTSTAP